MWTSQWCPAPGKVVKNECGELSPDPDLELAQRDHEQARRERASLTVATARPRDPAPASRHGEPARLAPRSPRRSPTGSRVPRPCPRPGTRRLRGRSAGRSRQVVPGQVERSGAAVHDLAAAPGLALAPAREGGVEQALEPLRRRTVRRLAGPDRHLRLDQLLAGRGQRRVGGAVALDPAGLLKVDDHERVAASVDEREVEAHRVPAQPRQALVAEQPAGVGQLGGDDHRGLGQRLDPRARLDLARRARERARCIQIDQRAPAADRIARGGGRREQAPDERLPQERRRELARARGSR